MPMYEFKCPNCEKMTTELCKIGEKGELLSCVNCGHVGLKKQLSRFASPGTLGNNSCSSGCCGNCSGCH